jgi:hypothetical protein
MNRKLKQWTLALVGLTALGVATNAPLGLGNGTAHAVIGRPLTPMSYAGVARRTVRRSAYAGAYYGGAYGVGYAPVAAGIVTALPAGCVAAGGLYTCGAVRYHAYYDGPTVVYQPVP